MAKKSNSQKDVIEYFNKLNLSEFQKGGRKYFTPNDVKTDPGGVIQKICELYHKIRPILAALLLIPFIPKKIKDAIKIFMDNMDKLCPDRR